MKTPLHIVLLFLLPLYVSATSAPLTINDPFYTYQAGISAGFNIAGSPVNGKGYHLGGMVRWGHHTFGGRFERESDVYGFTVRKAKKHTKTGGYYGFTFGGEHFQWGPQIGIGQLEYDYRELSGNTYVNINIERDTYFELAISALGGARGNGIGGKFFVLFSSIEKYVGFTIYIQAGYAWNKE